MADLMRFEGFSLFGRSIYHPWGESPLGVNFGENNSYCMTMEQDKILESLKRVECCRYLGVEPFLLCTKLCKERDRIKALKLIDDTFHAQLGKESIGGTLKPDTELGFVVDNECILKNTTDESLLFPQLYSEALLYMEQAKGDKTSMFFKHYTEYGAQRAKVYLDAFMEEWESQTNIPTSPTPADQPQQEQLPDILNTKSAREAFGKAIERGWMEKSSNRYKWLGFDGKAELAKLAYFCGKVYGYEYGVYGNQGIEFPEQALCKLFGVKRIYKQLVQVHEAKKKQRWRDIIDDIFMD